MVQRENNVNTNVIIPIWYDVSRNDVLNYSPSLADKKAILATESPHHVLSELLKIIKPEGSTLIYARDRVLTLGFEPPVVTDDWWLDVAEFSGSNYYLERWGFPLPNANEKPAERGERLAWAAVEMLWQNAVFNARISQITRPEEVLKFINSQPGLVEICHKYPDYLAAYVPQLTMRGFGGEFENDFETLYRRSLIERQNDTGGTELTTCNSPIICDERWALRHPVFGNYQPSFITCDFIQGELMGLPVRVYEIIDYIVWFLSNQSHWVPKNIHNFLLQGFKDWPVWSWYSGSATYDGEFIPNKNTGALFSAMYEAETFDNFTLTKDRLNDIETRFSYTIRLLGLGETAETLAQRFINSGIIESWFNKKISKKKS